jgi:hypothetical protein
VDAAVAGKKTFLDHCRDGALAAITAVLAADPELARTSVDAMV